MGRLIMSDEPTKLHQMPEASGAHTPASGRHGPMGLLLHLPSFRGVSWWLITSAAIVVAALNSRFIWIDIRKIMHRAVDHLGRHDFELFLHLWTAPLILITGALLFSARLRTRFPGVHRWAGRSYLAAVLITSIATLRLALHETEGPLAVVNFSALSVLWFGTALMAWTRAVQERFDEHGEWMIRNYALTLTNVTFRAELHLFLLLGAPFSAVYEPTRVLQWIPNLIVAEVLIRSGFFTGDSWKAIGQNVTRRRGA
jgi:hypothetical protein